MKHLQNFRLRLIDLAGKPGLDPRKLKKLFAKHDIQNLADLKRRLLIGSLTEKIGSRFDFQLRQALDDRPRLLLWAADKLVPAIETYLLSHCGVSRVSTIGSLRRRVDTIADIGFLVTGKSAATIFKRFATYGPIDSSKSLNQNEMLFTLSSGPVVRLVWTSAKQWGLSLLLQTGSKAHIAAIQASSALGKKRLTARSLGAATETEDDTYRALRLTPIEPELRENRGEIAAATQGNLPTLITLADLNGDLHMHTTASDGTSSIEEMAAAAAELGYQYIAITDHSRSLKIANGLTEKRLLEQIKAIDRINSKLRAITVLKSAEVDILENGELDYSNHLLKELDLTVCSIHSRFALDHAKQTERIMRAMDNPHFKILGHATGRLLLQREGYEPQMERLIEHAKTCGCYFEINSSPNRLDLSDVHAKMAKDAGVKIAINTDAHSISELGFITAGLNQARRAWLGPNDVLNAFRLAELRKLLKR